MIRLAVRVRREEAEMVLAELVGLAPGGVEEVDLGEEYLEYAIYGAEGELPALPDLDAAAGGVPIEVSSTVVADGWEDRWKEFHRPVRVEGTRASMTVSPPWESTLADDEVVIDPGRAFGTGAHPTTRLSLALLLGLSAEGSCVDLGCGSGVLAICSARLGWSPVAALDHDPASVEATAANAQANGVSVAARRFDLLRDGPAPGGDLVVANLLMPLLLELARQGLSGVAPRSMVASGLLDREADEVSVALCAAFAMVEEQRLSDRGWTALSLRLS